MSPLLIKISKDLKLAQCPVRSSLPRDFTFYLGNSFPRFKLVYCPRSRSYPRYFTLITRTARARASYLAALPSTRAIPDRDVFYVVDPSAPFATL